MEHVIAPVVDNLSRMIPMYAVGSHGVTPLSQEAQVALDHASDHCEECEKWACPTCGSPACDGSPDFGGECENVE